MKKFRLPALLALALLLGVLGRAAGVPADNWMPNLVMTLMPQDAPPLGCPHAYTANCPQMHRTAAGAEAAAPSNAPCRQNSGPGAVLAGCPGCSPGAKPGQDCGRFDPQAGVTPIAGMPPGSGPAPGMGRWVNLEEVKAHDPQRYANLMQLSALRGQCLAAGDSSIRERLIRRLRPLVEEELRRQHEQNRQQVRDLEARLQEAKKINQVREANWDELVTNVARSIAGLEPVRP